LFGANAPKERSKSKMNVLRHLFGLKVSKIFNNTCSLYFFLIPKKGIALLPVVKLTKKIKKMLKGHRPGTISKER